MELAREDNKRTVKHAGGRLKACWKGDSTEAARLAATDERIFRALADAVERHAAKDPGARGPAPPVTPRSESQ